MRLTYFLSIEEPQQHKARIQMAVSEITDGEITVTMPAWTPGSYLIRDFARNVRDFSATGADGTPLDSRKKDKSSWKINTGGNPDLKINYTIYADEFTVRSSHIDSSHAFVLGTSVFMYIEGYKDQAIELSIETPQGWNISTGLEKTSHNLYRAINYDVLVDSPIEIGTHQTGTFMVDGKEHEVALYGTFTGDFRKVLDDTMHIVEATIRLFEHAPYKRYVFIIHAYPGAIGNGLEHGNSCAISFNSSSLLGGDEYTSFLHVIAHEYFHTWNVKRIRPVELGPFNYKEENYTQLLWFAEGLTDYFADIILLRAHKIDEKKYLERQGEYIKTLEFMPGSTTSLQDSSFDSWIRLYKPSPDDVNSYISYYLKGNLVSLVLGIRIIGMSSGTKNLDQLMRILYEKFRKDGKGLTEKDILNALKEYTGADFSEFFANFVRGNKQIDFASELSKIGLKLEKKRSPRDMGEASWTGMVLKNENAVFTVSAVIAGKPAYLSGINAGDELVAFNGERFNAGFTGIFLKPKRITVDEFPVPGDTAVRISVFRRNILMHLEMRTEQRPADTYELVPEPESQETKKNRDKMLWN